MDNGENGKPTLSRKLVIVPEFTRKNLRECWLFTLQGIIEILFTKLEESDFVLAEEQNIDTWEKFQSFIVLLGFHSPSIIIQEIMNLKQNYKESPRIIATELRKLQRTINYVVKFQMKCPCSQTLHFQFSYAKWV